jgi:hypothetical protein
LRCKHCINKVWSPFLMRLTTLPRALCDGTAPTASHHHPHPHPPQRARPLRRVMVCEGSCVRGSDELDKL